MEKNLTIKKMTQDKFITNQMDDYSEFICGWGAAFINITLTFPVNKVMFRQMRDGVAISKAIQQLKHEGFHYLYRGILPPLIQKTISVSIMFGTYSQYGQMLKKTFPSVPEPICLGIAATLAGNTEALLTPFERIQTLMQDRNYHTKFRNTFHACVELQKFGIKEFYRGLVPILLRNGPSNVMFFGLRSSVKDNLPKTSFWWNELLTDFISGAVVGSIISTVFYPINVIKTKMQVCYGTPYIGVIEAFRIIYAERGYSFRKLFYGVHVNYTRALLSWGIINASYELLKRTFFPHL